MALREMGATGAQGDESRPPFGDGERTRPRCGRPPSCNAPGSGVVCIGLRMASLDVLQALREAWSQHVAEALRGVSPLAWAPATDTADSDGGTATRAPGLANAAAAPAASSADRCAYDPADLVALIQGFNHANMHPDMRRTMAAYGSPAIVLRVPSMGELRRAFAELGLSWRQLGVDDETDVTFLEEQSREVEAALARGDLAGLRGLARRGLPPALRPRVWQLLLGADPASADQSHYPLLQTAVSQVGLATDGAICLDAGAVIDDQQYFVFAEVVAEVVLAFSRDPLVLASARHSAAARFQCVPGDGGGPIPFPPSGQLPFSGLALLCCPLSYLFASAHEVFLCHRSLWCRYWCGLHAISTDQATVLPLLCLVNDLVRSRDPALAHHLAQLDIPAPKAVTDLLYSAFATALNVGQVLLLWDRIIGYDDVRLLAVCAAALLWYKREQLFEARTAEDVASALALDEDLPIIAVLQSFLSEDMSPRSAAGASGSTTPSRTGSDPPSRDENSATRAAAALASTRRTRDGRAPRAWTDRSLRRLGADE